MSTLDASTDDSNSSFDNDFFERQQARLSTLFQSLQSNIKQMEVDMIDSQSINSAANSNLSLDFTNTANTVIPNMVSKLDLLQAELDQYNNLVSNAHSLEDENAKLKSALSQLTQQYPESQALLNNQSILSRNQPKPEQLFTPTLPTTSPPQRLSTPTLSHSSQPRTAGLSPPLSTIEIEDTPKYQQLLRDFRDVQQQFLFTQQNLDNLKKTHTEFTVSTTIQIQQQLDDLDALNDKCRQYEDELGSTNSQIQTLKTDIHSLQSDKTNLLSQLSVSADTQQDLNQLRHQFINLQNDYDQNQNQLQSLKITINQLTQQLLQLQPLESQHQSLTQAYEQLQQQNAAEQETNSKLEHAIAEQLQQNHSNQEKNAQLEQVIADLQSKLASSSQATQSTLDQYQVTIQNLQNENEGLKQVENENEALKQRNVQLTGDLSATKHQLDISTTHLASQQQATAQAQQDLLQLQTEHHDLLISHNSLQNTSASHESTISDLTQQLTRLKAQHESEKAQYERQLEANQTSLQRSQDQVNRYHQQLQDFQTKAQQQQPQSPSVADVSSAQNETKRLRLTVDQLQHEMTSLINANARTVDQLQCELKSLSNANTQLTTEKVSLQEKLSFTVDEMVTLQDKLVKKDKDMEWYRLQLKEYSSLALPVPAEFQPTRIGQTVPKETLDLIKELETDLKKAQNEATQARNMYDTLSSQLNESKMLLHQQSSLVAEQSETILKLQHELAIAFDDVKSAHSSNSTSFNGTNGTIDDSSRASFESDQRLAQLGEFERQNQHQQQTIKALSSTIESLTLKLTTARNEAVERDEKIKHSEEQIVTLNHSIEVVSNQLQNAVSAQQSLQQHLQSALVSPQSQLSQQSHSTPQNQSQTTTPTSAPLSTHQKVQYEKQIDTWRTRAVKAKELLVTKANELQLVTNQLSLVVNKLDDVTSMQKSLQVELEQSKQNRDQQQINPQPPVNQEPQISLQQFDQLNSEYKQLQSEHATLTAKLTAIQTDLETTTTEHKVDSSILSHLRTIFQPYVTEASSPASLEFSQLAEVFESLQEAQTDLLHRSQNEIQTQRRLVYELEAKYSTMCTDFEDLQKKFHAISANLERVQFDYDELLSDSQKLTATEVQLNQSQPATSASANSSNQTQSYDQEQQEQQLITHTQGEFDQLTQKCSEYEELVISLQSEISGLQSTQHDLSVLMDKYNALLPNYDALVAEREQLVETSSKCAELAETISSLTSQLNTLRNDFNTSKQSHREVQSQLDDVSADYLSVKSENSRLLIQINNLSTQVTPMTQSPTAANTSNASNIAANNAATTNANSTNTNHVPGSTSNIPGPQSSKTTPSSFSTLPLQTQKLFMQSMIEALITSNEHTRPLVIENIMNMMEFAQSDKDRILKRQESTLLSENERNLVEEDLQRDRDELVEQLDVIGKGIMFIDSAWAWFNTPAEPQDGTKTPKAQPVVITNTDGTTTLVGHDGTTTTYSAEEYQALQESQKLEREEEAKRNESIFNKVTSSWVTYLSSDVEKVVEEREHEEGGAVADEGSGKTDGSNVNDGDDASLPDPLTGWVNFLLGDVAKVVGEGDIRDTKDANSVQSEQPTEAQEAVSAMLGGAMLTTTVPISNSNPSPNPPSQQQQLSTANNIPQSQSLPSPPIQQHLLTHGRQSYQSQSQSQSQLAPQAQTHQQQQLSQLSPTTLQQQVSSPMHQTFTYQQSQPQSNHSMMPLIYQRPPQPDPTAHTGVYNLFSNDLDVDLDLDS